VHVRESPLGVELSLSMGISVNGGTAIGVEVAQRRLHFSRSEA
jgi:hypothetical protein